MANERLQDRLSRFPEYSYRADPALARLPDDKPIIVFDGVCVLCTGFARFVVRRDPSARFRLAAAQSEFGQALFRHYGLDPNDFETNLLVEDGRTYGKLDALRRILPRLAMPWPLVAPLARPPGRLGDWCYDRIARNRYRLFGQTQTCLVPPPDWGERLIA
ncbi:MAG: DCC1-like thiol-disulfide oxidoreductase family protein [Hyphomicrobiaceae bacterium]